MAEILFDINNGIVNMAAKEARGSDLASVLMFTVDYLSKDEEITPQELLDRVRYAFNEIDTKEKVDGEPDT